MWARRAKGARLPNNNNEKARPTSPAGGTDPRAAREPPRQRAALPITVQSRRTKMLGRPGTCPRADGRPPGVYRRAIQRLHVLEVVLEGWLDLAAGPARS